MPLRRPRIPRIGWSYGPDIDYGKYLSPGEEVSFEVRKHGAALLRPGLRALLAWIFFLAVHNWLDLPSKNNPIDTLLGGLALGLTGWAAWRFLEWRVERVLVTNKRIVEVKGIFTRKVASMPLAKVTDITYQRDLLARALNYGELVLESAGQKQALESISFIPFPDSFYRDFMELLNDTPEHRRPDDADTGEIPRVSI